MKNLRGERKKLSPFRNMWDLDVLVSNHEVQVKQCLQDLHGILCLNQVGGFEEAVLWEARHLTGLQEAAHVLHGRQRGLLVDDFTNGLRPDDIESLTEQRPVLEHNHEVNITGNIFAQELLQPGRFKGEEEVVWWDDSFFPFFFFFFLCQTWTILERKKKKKIKKQI